MARWGVFIQKEGLMLYSYDDDKVMLTVPYSDESHELLCQIAREHNANAGLVELAQKYRTHIGLCHRPALDYREQVALDHIDAVLVQAEGREDEQ